MGIYSYAIAHSKVQKATRMARNEGFQMCIRDSHYLCLTNYSKSTMEFIIILLLLILNDIFAMYEIALVSSSKARRETLVGKGNKRAKGVLKQLEEP